MLTKKIKILYGLEAASGGALKHLVYLVTHLDKDVFDITVILSPRCEEANVEIDKLNASVTVINLPMSREISLVKDLINLLRIVKFLFKNKFDIVHAHSSKAGVYFRIAAWLNKVPAIIYTPHCFYFQSKKGKKRWFFASIERFIALFTDAIIVSVNEKKQAVISRIAPYRKLVNINNAINFDDYVKIQKEVALNELGLPENSIIIGTVGRLVEQKDLITLIQSARFLVKETPSLYFIIAGAGELNTYLQDKIAEFNLEKRIFLLGHQYEITNIYSAIDIFVSTSLWEGLPYVILEAMWYKKPIVATDLGYGEVLYDDQSEYLISPGDVSSLCEKLTMLIKDRQLCEDIGERNHIKVKENYPFDEFVRSHETLYLELFL